jgi:hypothetical protein
MHLSTRNHVVIIPVTIHIYVVGKSILGYIRKLAVSLLAQKDIDNNAFPSLGASGKARACEF